MAGQVGGSGSLSTKLRQIELVTKLISSGSVSRENLSSSAQSGTPDPEAGNILNTEA
ncbi:MAG: hypothetical protein ABEH89_01425 [bacterium]